MTPRPFWFFLPIIALAVPAAFYTAHGVSLSEIDPVLGEVYTIASMCAAVSLGFGWGLEFRDTQSRRAARRA